MISLWPCAFFSTCPASALEGRLGVCLLPSGRQLSTAFFGVSQPRQRAHPFCDMSWALPSHFARTCSPVAQTPSETVAKSIALQAAVEGSDLLRGGLTHTVISARWCPAGRGRVMSTWEVGGTRAARSLPSRNSVLIPHDGISYSLSSRNPSHASLCCRGK